MRERSRKFQWNFESSGKWEKTFRIISKKLWKRWRNVNHMQNLKIVKSHLTKVVVQIIKHNIKSLHFTFKSVASKLSLFIHIDSIRGFKFHLISWIIENSSEFFLLNAQMSCEAVAFIRQFLKLVTNSSIHFWNIKYWWYCWDFLKRL